MADLDLYKEIAKNLMERDERVHAKLGDQDNLYHLVWNMPKPLNEFDWLVPRIDPSPHNAVKAGQAAYSTLEPDLSITRPFDSAADRERFDRLEKALKYQLVRSSKRMGGSVVDEVLKSAFLYSEVVGQVVHVKSQLSLMGTVPTKLRNAVRRQGDYIINLHNPKNVHVRRSELVGTEAVVLKKHQSLADFVSFWGEDLAKPMIRDTDYKKNADKTHVVSYDYTDYDKRVVWAILVGETDNNYGSFKDHNFDGKKILMEDHGMDFIPWVHKLDGSMIEDNPLYQRRPLNFAVSESGAWNAANVAESLNYSEVVARAAAPGYTIEGPTDNVQIDYGDPSKMAHVPPGHKLTPLEKPEMDTDLIQVAERVRNDIRFSTVPQILISGDVPAGTAGMTVNQMIQSGLQTFAPYRRLGERWLEEAFCHMAYWSAHLEEPIRAPIQDSPEGPTYYNDASEDLIFYGYDIETKVELKEQMPVDELAKINAATLMVDRLNYSRARALEQTGESDPQAIFEDRYMEDMELAKVQGEAQIMMAEDQLKAQATLSGLQSLVSLAQDPNFAQFLQQLAQNPEAIQQMLAQGGGQQQQMGRPVSGQGMNPAMGGTPPDQANPGASSVGNSGFDAGGEQI